MRLTASLIPVKKITSRIPRSNFSEDAIEQAAQAILSAEGTINPLLLRQLDLRSFEVVDGHFEYYAAVRAKEIDLSKAEMIDAIVLQPDNETALLAQAKLLRQSPSLPTASTASQDSPNLETRLNNLEKFLERQFDDLSRKHLEEKKRLESFIQEIQNQLPKPLEPLELFNTASPRELLSKFKTIGLIGKNAEKVILAVTEQRQQQPFYSLADVTERVKGLSEKRMLALLDGGS